MSRAAPMQDINRYVKKYADLLGVFMLPEVVIRDNRASSWLGRCSYRRGDQNLIEIQKRATFDPFSLERVVAHEMCHHADFEEITDEEIARHRVVRRPSHGERWQANVKKVNAVMGKDFVTVTSDKSMVTSPVTSRMYFILIAKMNGHAYYAIGSTITPKAHQYILRWGERFEARLIKTNDVRWAKGPSFGSGKLARPLRSEDSQKLEELFIKATPIIEKARR